MIMIIISIIIVIITIITSLWPTKNNGNERVAAEDLFENLFLGKLWVALKRAEFAKVFSKGLGWGGKHQAQDLGTLSADTAGQLDVLGHDGDTLGVDGAQVGVLEIVILGKETMPSV